MPGSHDGKCATARHHRMSTQIQIKQERILVLTKWQPVDDVVIGQACFRKVVREDVRSVHERVVAGRHPVTVRDLHRDPRS